MKPNFHEFLSNIIAASEAQFLRPEYLHLHESDILEELNNYSQLHYLYKFIESVPNLKNELDSLICCYSYEDKSNTRAFRCKREKFYYLLFNDFNWKGYSNFIRKYKHYRRRPKVHFINDESMGIANLIKEYDIIQPYILIHKNKSVESIFDNLKKPSLNKICDSIKQFQHANSYHGNWYGFKFKEDKKSFWLAGKQSIDRLHVLSTGFIYHILHWNHELKNAHEERKAQKKLEFSTLINISAHVFKTAIKTDIISEIETIENAKNKQELRQLKTNSQHLFVLTGLVNLLTKINNKPAFIESSKKDYILSKAKSDWKLESIIEYYSKHLFLRKGYRILIKPQGDIQEPEIHVYNLFFSEYLIKSFLNTLLENIESHGYFEQIHNEDVCFLEVTSKDKILSFRNRAKEPFNIDSNKLTGNLLLFKSLIEKTGSGSMNIDCLKERGKYFFELKIIAK